MKLRSIFLLLVLTFTVQCVWAQGALLTAELTGFPDGTKFYLKDNEQDLNIDSATISDGFLKMRPKLGNTKGYWLYTQYNKGFYYTNLLIAGNDTVNISGSITDFPYHLKVNGSLEQETANILKHQTAGLRKKRDSLTNILMPLLMGKQNDSVRSIIRPMGKALNAIDSTIKVATTQFIETHPDSYAAVQELFYLKSNYPTEILTKKLAALSPALKESVFAVRLSNFLRVGNPLKKGDKYQDFEAFDQNNKTHRISDFAGKYILLDFTETYCGPCIQAVDDLKKMHRKYKDRLTIVSFYADKTKKVMLEGIKRDKPEWLSITDGKGTGSDILLKYGVNGFPTFVVIDPTGKIVSHFSGFGKNDSGKGNVETAIDKLLEIAK